MVYNYCHINANTLPSQEREGSAPSLLLQVRDIVKFLDVKLNKGGRFSEHVLERCERAEKASH